MRHHNEQLHLSTNNNAEVKDLFLIPLHGRGVATPRQFLFSPQKSDITMQQNLEEIWKGIQGHEENYFISNIGRIRSAGILVHFQGKLYPKKPKILKTVNNGNGYLYVTISVNNKRKNYYLHRLVASAFVENPHTKKWVNHKNGIKSDNCVNNLEWCTPSENQRHAVRTGLKKSGGDTFNAIKVINLTTKEIFGCIKDASNKLGINYGTLKDSLNRKGHYRQFIVKIEGAIKNASGFRNNSQRKKIEERV